MGCTKRQFVDLARLGYLACMDELLAPIFAELERQHISEAAASRAAVGNPSALKNLRVRRGERSRNHPIENLKAITDHLGLEFYIGPPRPQRPEPEATADKRTRVRPVVRYDVQLSAGPGTANDEHQAELGPLAFDQDWLDRHHVSAGDAMVLSVKGDSMAPTLCDGDMVLVDRRRCAPVGRRIYALVGPDGEARVKRLEKLPTAVLLHSDNDTYPTELIPAQDANRIRILGEVVWWGHTVRE